MAKKTSDIIQMVDFAHGMGVVIENLVYNELTRAPLVGRGPNNKDGAYITHMDDYPTIWVHNFVTGETRTFSPRGGRKVTDAERAAWAARIKAQKQKRDQETQAKHEAAAQKARSIYEAASSENVSGHPYAVLKKLPMSERVRRGSWEQRGWSDALLYPIYNAQAQVTSLAAINVDGQKDLLAGGKKQGSFLPIGNIRGAKLLVIGEGLATVLAVCHALGCPGVVALDKDNLLPVAQTIRELAPDADIIVLADDDQKQDTDKNPGIECAKKAAQAIGGRVAYPDMGKNADFWDVWHEQGVEAVRARIESAAMPADEWPEYGSLTVKIESLPYPIEALPPIILDAVLEVQKYVQAPIAMVVTCAISAISAACQGHGDVRRDHGLQGPSSLYFLTIAESGERKTTVDEYFTKAIHEYETDQREAHKEIISEYNSMIRTWEQKLKGIESEIQKLAKASKPTDQQDKAHLTLMASKPQPPRVPRIFYEDATSEALAQALAKGWPMGCLNSSEAGAVLGSHGMSPEKSMKFFALLNRLWDASRRSIDSDRSSVDSRHIAGARFSIGLQVQEETLREFIQKGGKIARGMGFWARILFCWPETTQGKRLYKRAPRDWPKLTAFNEQLSRVLSQRPNIDEETGAVDPPVYGLSPGAFEVWRQFHDEIEAELAPGGEVADVRDVAAKAADNAARMAALFHIFEGGQGQIEEETLRRASFIVMWHLNEARRFFGELALPQELADAARLDSWLLKQRVDSVPKNYVRQYGPNSIRDAKKLDAAIGELVALDRVRLEKRGRAVVIVLNPSLVSQSLEVKP